MCVQCISLSVVCIYCVQARLLIPECTYMFETSVVPSEHRSFQPCSHPAASKQQMVGLGAAANLAQSYLLGSNCVLTWRELEYYSNTGKQIIVTSLAERWLYLSHVQMEFDKLARDAALGCIVWFACLLVCLSTCLSTCLYPQQLLGCCLIHQPVCFCIAADVSVLQVFISESAAEEKKTLFECIKMFIHSL